MDDRPNKWGCINDPRGYCKPRSSNPESPELQDPELAIVVGEEEDDEEDDDDDDPTGRGCGVVSIDKADADNDDDDEEDDVLRNGMCRRSALPSSSAVRAVLEGCGSTKNTVRKSTNRIDTIDGTVPRYMRRTLYLRACKREDAMK